MRGSAPAQFHLHSGPRGRTCSPILRWRKGRLRASPLVPGIGSDRCQAVPTQRPFPPCTGGVGRADTELVSPGLPVAEEFLGGEGQVLHRQCQPTPGSCVKSRPTASSPHPLHHPFDTIHYLPATCQVPALWMPLWDFCTLPLPGQL